MSNKNNKSGNEEVREDKTQKPEVAPKGPITSEDIANEIVAPTEPAPAQKPEEKKGDVVPPPESKPEEKPEEKKEEKKEEPQTPPSAPFTKIGSQEFKTKEDFEAFAKSQVGYNTWLTGNIKRIHPDWFNADGSLKTKEVESASRIENKAKEAAETVAELSDEEELTPEQEAEMKKAKAVLKKLGVVFADDAEFKGLQDRAKRIDEDEVASAREVVAEFEKAHPLASEHKEGLANLIRERNYDDIDKAWKVYKIENGIEEQEKAPSDSKPPIKPVEQAIPANTPKGSGSSPPKPAEKDMIDDLLSNPGF